MKLKSKYKIYFENFRLIFRNPEISPQAKALLTNLLLYAGTDNNCFPGQELLAHDLGYKTTKQIRTILDELRGFGLISWTRGKIGKSNRYSFGMEFYSLVNGDRNSTTLETGIILPLQYGHALPPKEVSYSNHDNSSQIIPLFKKASKKDCTASDSRRLLGLSKIYTEEWVIDAIKEAEAKNKHAHLKVGLVKNILEDWTLDGKPKPKPVFIQCGLNGCDGGFIFNSASQSYRICECKEKFDKEVSIWEKGN